MTHFNELAVREEIKTAVADMGFTGMTEIQAQSIPLILEGREVLAKAPTGTGKTCAFGIPIIQNIDPASRDTGALILCPTRELCLQIAGELSALAKYLPEIRIVAVYGGQPIQKQKNRLKDGAQIIVATPGRLLDLYTHRSVDLKKVTTVVLDEADEMLDMGFFKDVKRIIDALPARQQMLLFSATISREVMDISWMYQRDPVEVVVKAEEESKPRITQYSLATTGRDKIIDVQWILYVQRYERTLIFCNTKYTTAALCETLRRQGYHAECLHGDMLQGARNQIMGQFKAGTLPILVATDVAARGIDVNNIDAVINYDMPQDNETYVHRIGRTARAKKEGISFLFHTPEDKKRLDSILRYSGMTITPVHLTGDGQLVVE